MTDGVLIINKPAGWTSQDVCAKLRNRLHIKKIGHTGTLDPMATGVLPVCMGKSTRIIEYYDHDRKSYHAVMKLGITTDTQDISGRVLSETPVVITDGPAYSSDIAAVVTENDIYSAFRSYTGLVSQLPPKYSALKIGGKRAYELARSGADFELKSREITVYENSVSRIDDANAEIEFDVSCSKGTYIRTICDDIGRSLGCGAVMTALTRTASGYFRIENAVGIEELCRMSDEEIEKLIIPADITLTQLGRIMLDSSRVRPFCSGNSSWLRSCRITEETHTGRLYRVYADRETPLKAQQGTDREAVFLGIAEIEGNSLVPVKVIQSQP